MSGFVYSITHGGMTYFGSSEQQTEKQRWRNHKSNYKNNQLYCCNSKIIFLRAELDEELPTFTVLEKYDDIDIEELKWIEQWYMDNFECVNEKRAIVTEEQHKEQKKENSKKYNEQNREKIAKYMKEYREQHKEQRKKYDKKNIDKINQKRREAYSNKKLAIQSVVL